MILTKLVALRRFRFGQEQGFVWLSTGDTFNVPEDQVAFYEKTGRAERMQPVKPKPSLGKTTARVVKTPAIPKMEPFSYGTS